MSDRDNAMESSIAVRESGVRFKQLSQVLAIPSSLYFIYALWQYFGNSGVIVRIALSIAFWVILQFVVLWATRIPSMLLALVSMYLSWAWSVLILCGVPWALEAYLLGKGLNANSYSTFFWLVEIVAIATSIWLFTFSARVANLARQG